MKAQLMPWSVCLGWLGIVLHTERFQVWSPIGVPMKGNPSMFFSHIDVPLSFSPSLSL